MRESTKKDYLQKSNLVIDYINAHLCEPLAIDLIAKQINTSKRQLLRILRLYLNEPLYSYITRLHMERAVLYMQIDKTSLAKVAEKVGYESPNSFAKAFKKHFNIPPKMYLQKLTQKIRAYTKQNNKGIDTLYEEIYYAESLNLVYIRIIGKYGEEKIYKDGWNQLTCFLNKHRLINESTRFIGISFDDPNITKFEQCRFYACATVMNGYKYNDSEFGTISIPPGKYAVYTLKESYSQLQDLYNNITANPKYKIRYGVTFEEYLNSPEDIKEENLLTKVFIPIK